LKFVLLFVKMTDYNALKVPELKKLLGDRNLAISGNKADLIARLQEDDKKTTTTGMQYRTGQESRLDVC
jgi:SAP domain-containing ribonucleoprotein